MPGTSTAWMLPFMNYEIKDHSGNVRLTIPENPAASFPNEPEAITSTNYYAFGGVQPHRNYNMANYRMGFNGQERNDALMGLGKFNTAKFWGYNPHLALRWNMDPEVRLGMNPYTVFSDNPILRIDPQGNVDDNYNISQNGDIKVTLTSEKSDKYYLQNTKGNVEFIGKFDKNENNLIELPSSFSFKSEDPNSSFSFNTKDGNEYRSYIRGDALASLMGALSKSNIHDLTVVGFSLSDGKSPSPSTSHKNGVNGDLRYLRTDKTGGPVLLGEKALDLDRQNIFNDNLYKFGWKSMLSEYFKPFGVSTTQILNHSSHYSKSRHNNHLHLQGYKPRLFYYGGILKEFTISEKRDKSKYYEKNK